MKKGFVYAFITALVFTTLEPVSKLIAEQVNPYAITFWRCMIGALVLMPFALIRIKQQKIRIGLKDIGLLCVLGTLLICISLVMLQIAVKKSDSPSLIAIIFSSNSVLTILLALIVLKEKMTKRKFLAVVLCVLGVLVCADFSSGTNLISVVYGLIAALSLSLYTVLSKKYMKKIGGVIHTALSFFFGSLVLLLGLLIIGIDILPTFTPTSITLLIYLGIVVTGIGYWAYNMAIEKGGAMTASLAFFIKPILTPVVTFLINGIVPEWNVFVAIVLIVSGSYLATYKSKQGEKCNENKRRCEIWWLRK